MKTITLNIEDDAHDELKNILGFKMRAQQDHEIDFQFIFLIFYGIHKNSPSITITKELIERGMRKYINKEEKNETVT